MASISCQHIYKIYPGATAPSVTDFNLEIQDKEGLSRKALAKSLDVNLEIPLFSIPSL